MTNICFLQGLFCGFCFFFNAALFQHIALSSFSHGEVITLLSHHILRLQVQFQSLQLSGNGTYRSMSGFPLLKKPPKMAQMDLCHLLLCTEGMGKMFCFLSFHVQPPCAVWISQPLHGEIPAICLDSIVKHKSPTVMGAEWERHFTLTSKPSEQLHAGCLPWGLQKGTVTQPHSYLQAVFYLWCIQKPQ